MTVIINDTSKEYVFKTNDSDDYNVVNMVQVTFSKEMLQEFFELRESLKKLNEKHSNNIYNIDCSVCLGWIDEIPSELQEVYEKLDKSSYVQADGSEEISSLYPARVDIEYASINSYGIRFEGYIKNTGVKVYTENLEWGFLEEVFKKLDPQSVQFIRD